MWCKILGPFALCILVGNPCISFGKCHLFSYLSVFGWGFTMFCSVFHVLNATFICVSLKSSVIFFVSLPPYLTVAHLVF
jgi:hypothetical protein